MHFPAKPLKSVKHLLRSLTPLRITALILIIVICGSGVAYAVHRRTNLTQQRGDNTTTNSPFPTDAKGNPIIANIPPSQIDASQAETAPPQPKTQLDLTGRGDQQTQTFTVSGDWHLDYSFDCSNAGGKGNFIFSVENSDGTTNSDTGANELGASGSSTDYYYDGGTHYLKVLSECSWHITVTG